MNSLKEIESSLRSMAKRYKTVKFSTGIAISFLMLGINAFAETSNLEFKAMTRGEISENLKGMSPSFKKIREKNNKALKGAKLEYIKLMEQGNQVVKSPWSSWQFGINYYYDDVKGSYKGRGDKKEKYPYEGIFKRDENIFNRNIALTSEQYSKLKKGSNLLSASSNLRNNLKTNYGFEKLKEVDEPVVAFDMIVELNPKKVEKADAEPPKDTALLTNEAPILEVSSFEPRQVVPPTSPSIPETPNINLFTPYNIEFNGTGFGQPDNPSMSDSRIENYGSFNTNKKIEISVENGISIFGGTITATDPNNSITFPDKKFTEVEIEKVEKEIQNLQNLQRLKELEEREKEVKKYTAELEKLNKWLDSNNKKLDEAQKEKLSFLLTSESSGEYELNKYKLNKEYEEYKKSKDFDPFLVELMKLNRYDFVKDRESRTKLYEIAREKGWDSKEFRKAKLKEFVKLYKLKKINAMVNAKDVISEEEMKKIQELDDLVDLEKLDKEKIHFSRGYTLNYPKEELENLRKLKLVGEFDEKRLNELMLLKNQMKNYSRTSFNTAFFSHAADKSVDFNGEYEFIMDDENVMDSKMFSSINPYQTGKGTPEDKVYSFKGNLTLKGKGKGETEAVIGFEHQLLANGPGGRENFENIVSGKTTHILEIGEGGVVNLAEGKNMIGIMIDTEYSKTQTPYNAFKKLPIVRNLGEIKIGEEASQSIAIDYGYYMSAAPNTTVQAGTIKVDGKKNYGIRLKDYSNTTPTTSWDNDGVSGIEYYDKTKIEGTANKYIELAGNNNIGISIAQGRSSEDPTGGFGHLGNDGAEDNADLISNLNVIVGGTENIGFYRNPNYMGSNHNSMKLTDTKIGDFKFAENATKSTLFRSDLDEIILKKNITLNQGGAENSFMQAGSTISGKAGKITNEATLSSSLNSFYGMVAGDFKNSSGATAENRGILNVGGEKSVGMAIASSNTGTNSGTINYTGEKGAGVYNLGDFSLTAGSVNSNGNKATSLFNKGTMNISGTVLVKADNGATGIYSDTGIVNSTSNDKLKIEVNSGNGVGVFAKNGAKINIQNSKLTAINSAGGVASEGAGSKIDLTGATLKYDGAGYAVYSDGVGEVDLSNSTLELKGKSTAFDVDLTATTLPVKLNTNTKIKVASDDVIAFNLKNATGLTTIGGIETSIKNQIETKLNLGNGSLENLFEGSTATKYRIGAVDGGSIEIGNLDKTGTGAITETEAQKEGHQYFVRFLGQRLNATATGKTISAVLSTEQARNYYDDKIIGFQMSSSKNATDNTEAQINLVGSTIKADRIDTGAGAVGAFINYGQVNIDANSKIEVEKEDNVKNSQAVGVYSVNSSVVNNDGIISVDGNKSIGVLGLSYREDKNGKAVINEFEKTDEGNATVNNKNIIEMTGAEAVGIYVANNDIAGEHTVEAINDGDIRVAGLKTLGIAGKNKTNLVNNKSINLNGEQTIGILGEKSTITNAETGKISVGKEATGIFALNNTRVNNQGTVAIGEKSTGILYSDVVKQTDTESEIIYNTTTALTNAGKISLLGDESIAMIYEPGNIETEAKFVNDSSGIISGDTGKKVIGMYAKEAKTGNYEVENKGSINLGDSDKDSNKNIGMYTTTVSGRIKLKNTGNISVGNYGMGIRGNEVENSGDIQVRNAGTAIYSKGGDINLIGGTITTGKEEAVAVYTIGNSQTINNTGTNFVLDETSYGFVNMGKGNTINSTVSDINLKANSTYIYSNDIAGTINNNTNIVSSGNENYGIYSAGTITNNGSIDFSSGVGNIGTYSIRGGNTTNNGIISVGASDIINKKFGIAMIADHLKENSGNIKNNGTIKVNGVSGIGIFANGRNALKDYDVENDGTIVLNADRAMGIFLDNGAKGINRGTIKTGKTGLSKVVGVYLANDSILENAPTGVIELDATQGKGVYISSGSIFKNYGKMSVVGENSKDEFKSKADTRKELAGINIDTSLPSIEITRDKQKIIPKIISEVDMKDSPRNNRATSIGMYIDTSRKNYTNPIENIGELADKVDLIIGNEVSQFVNDKNIVITDPKIIEPYKKAQINSRDKVEEWSAYSGSLTWIASIKLDKQNNIEEIGMSKIPYTEFSKKSDDKSTFNFLDGLEQRYDKNALNSNEKKLFNKLNSIGKNEGILFSQAVDNMMGHQYSNVQQRINETGNILDKEFKYLRKEWDTKSKDSNKVKAFGMNGSYKTETAGVYNYKNNAQGFVYLHENESIKLGNTTAWYGGFVHNKFEFDDYGKSSERMHQVKLGALKSRAYDDNNSLNWTTTGEIFGGRNYFKRNFLVVDEVFNAKSEYWTYGIGMNNELSKTFRLSEDFSVRPYGELKLEYGRFSKIKEKNGAMRLEIKANDYYSIKPEVGTEISYKHELKNNKTFTARLGVSYQNELGKVADTKNKGRVAYTTADWFDIRGEKENRSGNLKTDLNIGLDNERYGITANVGYDTMNKNARGGVGFRIIY